MHDDPSPLPPLKAVIVYDDLSAGRKAIAVLAEIAGPDGDLRQSFPVLWQFDFLDDPDWRQHATADVAAADLLIVATSARKTIPPVVEAWVAGLPLRAASTGIVILTLFGCVDDWNIFVQPDADTPCASIGADRPLFNWVPIATGQASPAITFLHPAHAHRQLRIFLSVRPGARVSHGAAPSRKKLVPSFQAALYPAYR